MKRRSFFSKLASIAAVVSLAPRLAFRAPDVEFLEKGWFIGEFRSAISPLYANQEFFILHLRGSE